mmetsp:Transcript_73015/g.171644  ORF Transcript_73015/g.171644 Transcript_73015/m.171644 type:complete len:210 (-) Transcript_73015:209-838(-)
MASPAEKRRQADERFAMSAQEYLERVHISVFLQDAVKQLLELRDEQPLEFLASYFSSVLKRNHVTLREFAFINACPLNRHAFVDLVLKTYVSFSSAEEFSMADHFQLVRLLCPSFSSLPYDAAARWIAGGSVNAPCSYPVASAHFQLFFVHSEFIAEVEAVFARQNSEDATGAMDRSEVVRKLTRIGETRPTIGYAFFGLRVVEPELNL